MRLAQVVGLAVLAALIHPADAFSQAANYPNRAIKLIIAFPPGGIADITGRVVAQKMSEDWGQPIVVENRPGGSANPGTKSAAVAPPDGYTLLLGNVATHAINIHLYGDTHYHPVKDFTPIGRVAETPLILIAGPKVPYNTIPELVAYAKANPGKLNFGSAGPGSISHMGLELLKSLGGIDIAHVPYRGTNAVVPDLLSGQIDGYFDAPGSALANVLAKNLKAIGVGGMNKMAAIPEVATINETLPGYEIATWFGLFAPAGLPADITAKINAKLNDVLAQPDIKRRLTEQFLDATPSTPRQLADYVNSEIEKYGKITRAVGMAK